MFRRSPPKRQWHFILSPEDTALLRSMLPAEELVRPRPPMRKWLWALLVLPLLAAAGAALLHFFPL
jgi:hypothetical protein